MFFLKDLRCCYVLFTIGYDSTTRLLCVVQIHVWIKKQNQFYEVVSSFRNSLNEI